MSAYYPGLSVGSQVGFNSGSQPAFDGGGLLPNSLSGLALWLDSGDLSTISQTGGAVNREDDKSGVGSDATQGTGSAQPTTNASTQNGRNLIDYATNDFLILPITVYSIPNGNNSLFVVANTINDTSNERVVFMGVGGGTRYGLTMSASSGEVDFLNSNGAAVTATGVTKSNFNIYSCYRDGTSQSISVNGGTAVTNASGSSISGIDEASLGSYRLGNSSFLNGSIAEVIIYNRALSTSEMAIVNTYLSNKWGIALA